MKIHRMFCCLVVGISFVAGCPSGNTGGETDPNTDTREQLLKLKPNKSSRGDRFGTSVAISGMTAIVMADRRDNARPSAPVCESGSAYLFDTNTGDQIAELLPFDGAGGVLCWGSVAISGTTAILGAVGDGQPVVSVFVYDTTTGEKITELIPDDGAGGISDGFGESVAISGSTAIVGAVFDNNNVTLNGSAYLFDTTTGRQRFKLVSDGSASGEFFGFSVAISGQTAIVGDWGGDDACPENRHCDSGSAYLFDTTTGEQIAKLLPNDGALNDHFGTSVAISGNTAIVGATQNSTGGAAYVFDTVTGRQVFKLVPDQGENTFIFGTSVAISGNTAIVGAPLGTNEKYDSGSLNTGLAYLFDTTTGNQIAKLGASDGADGDFFGSSVAISGSTAVVGAWSDDDACPENPDCESGSAYVFDATRR